MDLKEDIRSRLPIDQLVAQYCQLKKKGRNFVSLCPFHNDKNPSFLISPDKGIAYCFACQSGGDIFSFFQKIENVDFPTALRMLAEKAGIDPKQYDLKPAAGPSKDEKQKVRECLEAAQEFYCSRLQSTPEASAYVEKRGVPEELRARFGIGYAPDSFSDTYDYLLKRGFGRSEIVAAGLGVQKDLGDQRIYDRFRNRIMFPIFDAQGSIVGFGGRAMGEADAKYVNSPEGILYSKSSVLFGLSHAREAIRKTKKIVLVEGYFDVVAAHKAGIENVVAVSGTALTEEHVRILKRYGDEIILCLDQDAAGQAAASRSFGLLARALLPVRSVTIPAKDPDELVQRDASHFAHVIAVQSVPYIEGVIAAAKRSPELLTPAGRHAFEDVLFPLLQSLPSSVELRSTIEHASRELGVVQSELLADFNLWTRRSPVGNAKPAVIVAPSSSYSCQELSMGLALIYPNVRPLLSELIRSDDRVLEGVRLALMQCPVDVPIGDVLIRLPVDGVGRERFRVLALYCEEHFPDWSETLAEREMRKMIGAANHDLMRRKQLSIVMELKEARRTGRVDEEAKLLTQYQQVLKLTKMAGTA